MRSATEPVAGRITPTGSASPTFAGSTSSKRRLSASGERSWIYREGRIRSFWGSGDIGVLPRHRLLRKTLSWDRSRTRLCAWLFRRRWRHAEIELLEAVPAIHAAEPRESRGRRLDPRPVGEFACGRIHNPSGEIDPNDWRVYVRSISHERFLKLVGSWHPRKRQQIDTRMVR